MKKYLSLALAATMMMSLMACSANNETNTDTDVENDTTVTTPADITIDLEALSAEIEGKVEMPMLGLADELTLNDSFGLAEGDLEEAFVRIPMMAVSAVEYGIFKGDADVIAAALEQRMAGLETTWSQYLPDQYDLVLNYSTYTQGDYVMYVIANEGDKQYFENAFLRAFAPSIEELIPAVSFSNVTAEVLSVEENGVTVLVDGVYVIAGTYGENCFINPDEATGEAYVPQISDYVDLAFETAVTANDEGEMIGVITYMGVSVQYDLGTGDMGVGDMGVGDMGVGDMGVGDMGIDDGMMMPAL